VSELEKGATAGEGEKPKGISNTLLRFVSVLPLIPFILWLMFTRAAWGGWGFRIFILTAVAIAASELMRMTIPSSRGARLWGIVATVGFTLTVTLDLSADVTRAAILGLVLGALVVGLAVPDPVERAALRIFALVGGPLYIGGTLGLIDRLHGLPHGGGWVFLSMCLAWLSDTGAYFAGRKFGKTKLYPKLSPQKTVAGALGGLGGSVLGAVIASLWLIPELPMAHAVPLALVAGASGQAGDLFESLIKRATGVKDSGTILPGHGGILDRADALMFTGALTWVYATFLCPGP